MQPAQGLQHLTPGMYQGLRANYLSYVTERLALKAFSHVKRPFHLDENASLEMKCLTKAKMKQTDNYNLNLGC